MFSGLYWFSQDLLENGVSSEVEETKSSVRYKAMKVGTPELNIFVLECYYPIERILGLITVEFYSFNCTMYTGITKAAYM